MVSAFKEDSGLCTDAARGAIRLGFHDAAGWSKSTGPSGGADGSILLAEEEINRPINLGLQEIAATTKAWYDEYKEYGISAADLIQMGANVATVVCPLGPRTKTYVGRNDSSVPAPGPLPDVNDSADNLIKLFQDKTIQPNGLTALLGAHSTAKQRFVDPARAGDPQDSTPGVWDMVYYNETINPNAPTRVSPYRFSKKKSSHDDNRASNSESRSRLRNSLILLNPGFQICIRHKAGGRSTGPEALHCVRRTEQCGAIALELGKPLHGEIV